MPDHIQTESDTKPIGIDPNDRINPPPPINPIAEGIQRISDHSERQREKDAPTIEDFSNSKTVKAFHTRLRVIEFIFCCSTAGDHVTVAFGGRIWDFLLAVGTTVVPFPAEIDRGIDITFANVTSADHLTYFYLVAYTE
jgi:hypothetical protein